MIFNPPTRRSSLRLCTSAVLVASLAVMTLPAMGQQRERTPRRGEQPQQREMPNYEQRTFDLDFEGGTVRDYVNAISEQTDAVNVMLDSQAESFPVPAVEFRSVDVQSAIFLLHNRVSYVDGQRIELDVDEISPPSVLSLPVYSVRAEVARTRRGQVQSGESAAVLSIRDVLNADYSADDVLTAIESAIGLIKNAQRAAEIRFHEQTGLLIARGTGEQMAAVHEVIDQLREGIERARHEEDSQQVITRLRSEINELHGVMEQHEVERRELMQQLTEARTRAALMQQQYEQTQARVHDYERRVAELRQELTEVRNAYSELERRLQRPNPDGNH